MFKQGAANRERLLFIGSFIGAVLLVPSLSLFDATGSSLDERKIMLATKADFVLDASTSKSYFAVFDVDEKGIASLAFSPDGHLLACVIGGGDRIDVWDVGNRRLAHRFKVEDSVFAMAFSVKRDVLYAGYGRGQIRLWDTKTGQVLETWNSVETSQDSILGMATSPNGKWLATCGRRPTLWNLETKQGKVLDLTFKNEHFDSDVRHVKFLSDSRHFVTACSRLLLWEVASGKMTREAKGNEFAFCVEVSSDGNTIATGSSVDYKTRRDGAVLQLWDAASVAETADVRGFGSAAASLVFSPDNKLLVVASASSEKKARAYLNIWNLYSGAFHKVCLSDRGAFSSVLALSPDGKALAVVINFAQESHKVRLYKLESLLRN